ncbi:branched-chain amino acid ABC transporter permease [Limobrevibacterium gyesilva]|uniref:Branched-chain amino acid ABC transporter permease n=1 Tax=Limobrevibacterium gyesilva TaxID=2991712 RepID=A0AA41YQ94_9PROT|nr:branched-chain amino acid ABC transporter permease [Limobrevibacterium gyesilva]MCW3473547.1 branched-chain amino acid ABC transporter permease [Limobrevibacterium gyesilva]
MFAQQLVNGVLLGATYALFALGFTLMFGVLRVINLTYGFYFSAGAFIALFLTRQAGFGIWAALPVAAMGAGAVAVALDWLLLSRLRRVNAPELSSLMVTLGGVLALYSAATSILGPDIRRLPPDLVASDAFVLAGLRVTTAQLLILLATAVMVGALMALMRGTRLGLAIRAMAEKPDAAGLMGIDTGRLAALVSFISGCLAGAGGVLIGLNFNAIHPYMGEAMMLRGFVVIIVGGLGDIRGALIAGLLLGVIEVFTAGYVASGLKEAVAFAILVVVLWTRPSGLFGRAVVRRA